MSVRPPSKLLWAAELPRGAFGLASLLGARAMLAQARAVTVDRC